MRPEHLGVYATTLSWWLLRRLRKLGLGELIRRSEDGYFLDPSLAVSRLSE